MSPAYSELTSIRNFKESSHIKKNRIYHFLAFQLIITKADKQDAVDYYNSIIAKVKEVYGNSDKVLKLITEQEDKKCLYLDSTYHDCIDSILRNRPIIL